MCRVYARTQERLYPNPPPPTHAQTLRGQPCPNPPQPTHAMCALAVFCFPVVAPRSTHAHLVLDWHTHFVLILRAPSSQPFMGDTRSGSAISVAVSHLPSAAERPGTSRQLVKLGYV